ncbi:MAG: OmpH family outer membrane protein [Alphaproteobacteria bacterium]|nr:OmpH family outer membrane protein [Alphaproteobacteria bacterium]
MSRFDNSPNYGLIFFVVLLTAVITAAATRMLSNNSEPKFAVVDVQRVLSESKDVAALKTERANQIAELQKMADDANAKLAKISDEDAKKKESEKYLAEINTKKEGFDKMYVSALQASDQKLNDIIKSVADKENLTVIISKGSVVNGGVDITDSVVDMVK